MIQIQCLQDLENLNCHFDWQEIITNSHSRTFPFHRKRVEVRRIKLNLLELNAKKNARVTKKNKNLPHG